MKILLFILIALNVFSDPYHNGIAFKKADAKKPITKSELSRELDKISISTISIDDKVSIVETTPSKLIVDTTDVSNPPTDAELDAVFIGPSSVGAGWMRVVDDNDADTNVYLVISNGTSWWVLTGTKAT